MGTFHDTDDPLHGITVAVTIRDRVFVGRCHERNADTVVLMDADEHHDGDGGRTNEQYLARAARLGVWKKHARLELPAREITSMAPLGEFYRRSGAGPGASAKAPAPPPPAVGPETDPGKAAADPDQPVTLTEGAVAEVKRLLAAEQDPALGLRLGVAGGGCSGLVYKTEFSARKDGDLVVPQDGFEVYLDPKSAIYLRDVVLDFQPGLSGRGFQFRNPNASNTCGCGESFAV